MPSFPHYHPFVKDDQWLAAKTLLKEVGCLVLLNCMRHKKSPFFLRLMVKIELSQYFNI